MASQTRNGVVPWRLSDSGYPWNLYYAYVRRSPFGWKSNWNPNCRLNPTNVTSVNLTRCALFSSRYWCTCTLWSSGTGGIWLSRSVPASPSGNHQTEQHWTVLPYWTVLSWNFGKAARAKLLDNHCFDLTVRAHTCHAEIKAVRMTGMCWHSTYIIYYHLFISNLKKMLAVWMSLRGTHDIGLILRAKSWRARKV